MKLSPSFVSALGNLHVTPTAVGPGRLYEVRNSAFAAFPITAGAVDLKDVRAQIDHSGGLALTAGETAVTLSDFAIQLDSKAGSVLTGVVTVNGSLVARIPLFDLSLAKVRVWAENRFLDVDNVTLKLDAAAAEALSDVFHTTIPQLQVGTAEVRTVVAGYNDL